MELSWILKGVATALLLPPLNGLLPIAAAWFFDDRRWRRRLVSTGCLLLILQSLSPVADLLVRPLERMAGRPPVSADGAQAIVILAGGVSRDAIEYGGDTVSSMTLERVRYGATLAKRLNLPVLVSGGSPDGRAIPEAVPMAAVLQTEYGVPVTWVEAVSSDTRDQANEVKRLLAGPGVERILLVTHAFHLPRARRVFEQAGFGVVAAPTAFLARQPSAALQHWLPQMNAMHKSWFALHEWIGLGWYAAVDAWGRGSRWVDSAWSELTR